MPVNIPLAVERFLGIYLVVIGLSHILAAKQWVSVFNDLFTKPWAGLLIGMITLPFGLVIILTHNIWVLHWALLTTIVGWGSIFKGTLYLLAPATPKRVARDLMTVRTFVIGGMIAVLLGAAIAFGAFAPVI